LHILCESQSSQTHYMSSSSDTNFALTAGQSCSYSLHTTLIPRSIAPGGLIFTTYESLFVIVKRLSTERPCSIFPILLPAKPNRKPTCTGDHTDSTIKMLQRLVRIQRSTTSLQHLYIAHTSTSIEYSYDHLSARTISRGILDNDLNVRVIVFLRVGYDK
jgi:hypothetical protein